ncbi:MAG: 1-acyl-sn-glycerol-3-phosphate acyltransferase [Oscillospiraceae bacterium]|nr:1-acyl-sn-glycerol-3-phosphate acyltransferase [Oscillospiraceae bacterium]
MQRKIITAILGSLMILVFRVKKIGEENIPKEGAVIICPNHVHFFDPPAVVLRIRRKIYPIAKEELLKNPVLKYLAKVFEGSPVKRDGTGIAAVKAALKILKDKEGAILIYPEGTRNGLAKGRKPKDGGVTLALKTGAPIIPVGIQGNFKLFTKVRLNIGKPIYYTEEYVAGRTNEELTKELMDEIVRLRDEDVRRKSKKRKEQQ